MKAAYIFGLSLFLISCNDSSQNRAEKVNVEKNDTTGRKESTTSKDSTSWIESFRAFRDAVYHHDKVKAKAFVDFPIMNENNEIWYLAYDGAEKLPYLSPDKIKPFTAKDFDLYFDKIFSKQFVNAILKIKTDEFFKKGEAETIELKDGKTKYRILATLDRPAQGFNLNLAYETGEGEETTESNVIYFFNVLKNGDIRFKQVRLAG